MEMQEQIARVTADVSAAADALARDVDGAEAERAELMKPFTDPAGQWRFAPASERAKAEQQIEDEQRQRQGQLMFRLSAALTDGRQTLAALQATAEQAPSPEEAWGQRTGERGVTASVSLQLQLLDEQRQARFSRELDAATVDRVLAQYLEAQRDPTTQANASLIAFIERRHAAGHPWGSDANGSHDGGTARRLSEAIREARQRRVPADLTKALDVLTQADDVKKRARLRKVEQRRPA